MQNFVVYKSSAGSGKTFTLVKEYLRLALFDEKKLTYNYKRILAVTFTNKAASEMKSRVVEALNDIAYGHALPFVGELLCEELKTTAAELKRRAKIVLSHILHHYSDFSIGTIDSFTHKIVKTFAHDLKLPVNFNIELDTENFYEKVISTLFSQVGEDDYVSKLLKEYVLAKAEDNSSWDPEKQIKEFSRLLQKENSEGYLALLKQFDAAALEDFRKQFIDFTHYYKSFLKTEAQKAIDLIQSNHLSDNDFIYKGSGPQNFFRKCIDNAVNLESAQKGRIIDAVASNKWAGKDTPENITVIEKISPTLNAIANTLLDFIRLNYAYFALCEALGKQMIPLMLLKKIEEISLEKKQDERLVFISEFNHKIFEIIDQEPTPFIYERLGERYQHYLLDEFQDTSSLQWQNILPLLDNSLSGGWFNLVVGDGKQSIYRWRNANVKQFSFLPEIENAGNSFLIEERAQSLQRNFEEKILDTNFRSLKTIVTFNNSLFEFLSERLLTSDYKNIYAGQSQKIKNNNTGYISVNTAKVEKEELDSYTCSLIQQQIHTALGNGFDYKDICILARKNYHGNIIANYLVDQKIPVVSSDSLLLKNNFEINTILCYLNYLVNNQDVVSAASVVNYLYQSAQITEADFHLYLSQLSKGKSLYDIFRACNIQWHEEELGLANLLDHCIAIITALKLNLHNYNYIRFFLDEVNEFLVLKSSNISSFFDWWAGRSNKASMIIPENTNAVSIMTIHASKGLEFPVVIVPYCNWSLYKANDSWVHINHEQVSLPVAVIGLTDKAKDIGLALEVETEKQEQVLDNLNLLYVAFTRAIERLHIITVSSTGSRQKSVGDWLMEFLASGQQPGAQDFYEIGQLSSKQSAHKKNGPANFDLEPLQFTTSQNVVRIKAAYLNNSEHAEEAKQQGIAMHWILSKIRTAADLDKALELGMLEGLVNQRDIAPLKIKLDALIHHPRLVDAFKAGIDCKLEAELVTQNGELLRPDRIILAPGETILIDYKTGKENNARYSRQMLSYELALQSMGYSNIKKMLVYVDDLIIVDVK